MKMIKFKKHIPAACRVFDEEEDRILSTTEYSCIQDILDSDWCKRVIDDNFKKFSISRDGGKNYLMLEQNNGSFWVMGYLDQDIPELPTWIYPRENKENEYE